MSNPFAAPSAPGAGIDWSAYNGQLLFIEPLSLEEGIKTSYGDADAIRANVVVLDGDDAPAEYPDTLVFPKVLQSQLRSQLGQKVLGRLGQGTAKPGQSPPWMLAEATADDVAVGKRWLAHVESKGGGTPAPAAAAPAASTPF